METNEATDAADDAAEAVQVEDGATEATGAAEAEGAVGEDDLADEEECASLAV